MRKMNGPGAKMLTTVIAIVLYHRVAAFSIRDHSIQLRISSTRIVKNTKSFERTFSIPHRSNINWSSTSLRGLDFEAIENDEECDFGTDPNRRLPDRCIELPMPNESLSAVDVVSICMEYLQNNDEPKQNSGLEVCFNFSSDSCQAANGGSLENFLNYANNPTFQTMVNCKEWEVLNVGPEIAGTNTRGAMKTVLINVVRKEVEGEQKNDRRFLWTLMKERRPPRQGCFLIHECITVEDALYQTLEK